MNLDPFKVSIAVVIAGLLIWELAAGKAFTPFGAVTPFIVGRREHPWRYWIAVVGQALVAVAGLSL